LAAAIETIPQYAKPKPIDGLSLKVDERKLLDITVRVTQSALVSSRAKCWTMQSARIRDRIISSFGFGRVLCGLA
jgi:hypothetical protein